MSKEPDITINGTKLTDAQAMTVRVAIQFFGFDLSNNGLGDDETGKQICTGYLRCIAEINKVMMADQT